VRDAAGEFHHFEAALHRALGVGQHLAVLGGNEQRQLVMCFSTSSLKRNITRPGSQRSLDQPRKPLRVGITRSTSAFEARGTLAASAPCRIEKRPEGRALTPDMLAADEVAQFTGFCKRGITGIHGTL